LANVRKLYSLQISKDESGAFQNVAGSWRTSTLAARRGRVFTAHHQPGHCNILKLHLMNLIN